MHCMYRLGVLGVDTFGKMLQEAGVTQVGIGSFVRVIYLC